MSDLPALLTTYSKRSPNQSTEDAIMALQAMEARIPNFVTEYRHNDPRVLEWLRRACAAAAPRDRPMLDYPDLVGIRIIEDEKIPPMCIRIVYRNGTSELRIVALEAVT